MTIVTLPTKEESAEAFRLFEEEGDFKAVPNLQERCYQYWLQQAEASTEAELKRVKAAWKKNNVAATAENIAKSTGIIERSKRLAGLQAAQHAATIVQFHRILSPVDQNARAELTKWISILDDLHKRYTAPFLQER